MKGAAKVALSIGALGGGIGFPFLTYDQVVLKPIRKENKYFEKIFETQKDLINSLKIEGLDPNEDPVSAAPKINEGCSRELESFPEKKEAPAILLHLCKSKFSTVKKLLSLFDNKEFIKNEEDYEVSLFFLRKPQKLNAEKSKLIAEITDNKKFKTGCEKQLNTKIIDFNEYPLEWVNFLCKIQMIDTVEKVIKEKHKDGKIFSDNGEEIFEKGKNVETFSELFKKYDESITKDLSKEQGGPKLKEGCENTKNKKLSKEIDYDLLNHVFFICSGKNPPVNKNLNSDDESH